MPVVRKTKEQQRKADIRCLFRQALIAKDWSQEHLGELLGVDQSMISKAFNDPFSRKFEFIVAICDKLGVNIGDALWPAK